MDEYSEPRDSKRSGQPPSATATVRARPSAVETLAASPEALQARFTPRRTPAAPLGSTAPVVHPPGTHLDVRRPSAFETLAAPPKPSVVGTLADGPAVEDTVAFLGPSEAPKASVTGTVFRGSAPSTSAVAASQGAGDLSTPSPLRNGQRPIEAPDGVDRNLALARLQERMLGVQPEAVKIGRFIVIRKLGQGAMGIVYLAFDPKLDRKVALKLVDTSALGSEMGDAQVRLEREAKAAAALGHPNVVTVYDVGEHGDDVFLAMEYVEGSCLTDWMKQEHDWRETVTLFAEIARGLAAAHDADLVHRDFKPDNVLMGEDGRPRVADFGLARPTQGWSARDAAKMIGEGTEASIRALSIGSRDALASTGEVCGTPAYMAPEQFAGIDVGAASDQFGFCASLYEALFGHRPFKGDSVTELAVAVLENDRQPLPPRHGVPKAVVEAVLQGLDPKVKARHPSMHALADRLETALRARTRNRMLAGGALLAVLGIGFGARASQALDEQPCDAAHTELQDTWNDDTRAAVRSALAGAGLSGEVTTHLDAFATTWTEQRVAICEATRVEGVQSQNALQLRMACLDRAERRLSVASASLSSSPTPPMLAALDDALGELTECRTAAVKEQADAYRAYGEDSIEQQATWANLEADIAFLRLHGAESPSKWEEVAASVAQQGRDFHLPHAAAVGLRWVGESALRRDDLAAAQDAFREALPYAAVSLDRGLTPELLKASGQAALLDGDFAAAQERLQLAIAFAARIQHEGRRSNTEDQAKISLAEVALRRGEPRGAREQLEALLARDRPRPALLQERLHSTLGAACWEMHDPDCAFEHHAKAMEITASLPDIEPLELAGRHANMGLMYAEAGDGPKAIDALGTAADIVEGAFGADHPMRGQLLSDRGGIHSAMMDPHDGERDLLAGLAIHERHHGKDHPALVEALIDLTKTQTQLGKLAEATNHGEWALRIVDDAFEDEHPRRADPRLPLSEVYAATGHLDDAVRVLREGIAILDTPKAHPMQKAEFQFALARALAPSDVEAAREAAAEAKASIADFEPGKPLHAAIERWSAQVLDAQQPDQD